MRALDIACPTCAQQAREVCIDEYRIPLSYYHAKRISDAVACSIHEGKQISREEFERAVEDSGQV